MELHRKLNPDWRFGDATNYLLSEIATIQSHMRYFAAAQIMGDFEDVPAEYLPASYGPKREPEQQPVEETTSVDRARQVAEDIRAGMLAA